MKKIFKLIIFIIVFVLLLCIFNEIFNPSGTLNEWYSTNCIRDFYKQKADTIDVIYLGNSCVYTGISPVEIYENSGITGYSFSSSGQKTWSSYYLLKDALKTQKPKVVFLEAGETLCEQKDEEELNKRNVIDSMPLSENKLSMINDSIYNFSQYDKLGCIFPILRYHSRWNRIKENDLRKFAKKGEITYKGYLLERKIAAYNQKDDKDKKRDIRDKKENENQNNDLVNNIKENADLENSKKNVTDDSEYAINKIMKLCKENNCELVLIKIPEPTYWTSTKYEAVKNFAEKKGLKYIDLNYDSNITMDWNDDTQDGGNHLNVYGAEKIGNYLANYLKVNFELEDHREDKKYNSWNELVVKYDTAKQEKKNQ